MVEGARRATGTIPNPEAVTTTTEDMSNEHSSELASDGPKKKRRFLSAEKKFQIYLEAQSTDKPVGELLRREGLFSTDLARIRQQVKEGALVRLSAKPGRKAEPVASFDFESLKQELAAKERALADMAVELTLLRKKTNGVSSGR
jgi:transposase-like protein